MNSGCICCTLVGDFAKSMREVMEKFSPDRILIEPSGVGKLSDVMASVIDMEKEEDVKLNALVTVVNALKADKQMKAFGEFFNNQIEHATTVVLSRTQKAAPEQVEETTAHIHKLNPNAVVITTPWDQLSGAQMLGAMEGQDNLSVRTLAEMHHQQEEAEHEHEHHHEHEHDHEHEHEHAEGNSCGSILRSKGMVPSEDGTWIYFDFVDGEYELREGEPDYTGRLVVIGANLKEDRIEKLFGLDH